MKTMVVSFIGKDKKGIVDSLSQIIQHNGGNWQVSSLHHIAGYFSGVIEINVDDGHAADLQKDLENFEGLSCQIGVTDNSLDEKGQHIQLDIMANDRTGIVQEISSKIHLHGGNLIKLVSKQENAPHTGQQLFKAKATVSLSSQADKEQLIGGLEALADDLVVDIV